MATNKPSPFALLPTALLFGLGIGNLWGVAGIFTRLGNPEWAWVSPVVSLSVLVACLCEVARAWWPRGAFVPLFTIVVAGWLCAAPWAAVTGEFTTHAWGLWLVVLVGCAALALLIAWLLERNRSAASMPNKSLERTRES
jgi:hypothetical protein